ncbi:MAG: hypothetical protein JSV21_07480 [Nitrospirota bacterium]|nr:MAG: hypothetical protein JSV21_07480 [Nitrospirota bacterium]
MNRQAILLIAFIFIYSIHAFAGEEANVLIELKTPAIETKKTASLKSIFIESVSDSRAFSEPDVPAIVPSWGLVEGQERTDDIKYRAVARAVWRGGSKGGNVLIGNGDVMSFTKEIISSAFRSIGYDVIEDKTDIKADTIMVSLDVMNFWAYFEQVIAGGSITTNIETSITMKSDNTTKKITIKVSGNRWAYNPRKPSNWEAVYNMSLSDMLDTAVNEIKK